MKNNIFAFKKAYYYPAFHTKESQIFKKALFLQQPYYLLDTFTSHLLFTFTLFLKA